MPISAANINPYYVEQINSSSNVACVRKINDSKLQNEEKSYLKYSTQDQRNLKVSEEPEEKKTIPDYNIPLQHNAPAARLLKILKSFNEAHKIVDANSEEDYTDFTEISEASEEKSNHPSPGEIGYYVVLDERNSAPEEKKINRPQDMWRRRINNTYHLGFMKEPGTLVNVVV